MRVVLFTGKGGVGKSTTAAATALRLARPGARRWCCPPTPHTRSPTRSAVPLGDEPDRGGTGPLRHAGRRAAAASSSLGRRPGLPARLLDEAGVDPVAAEELTVIPGAEEVLALLELRELAATGDWDPLIVDCAPTAETLRLLALPEALGWYMHRVFPAHRRIAGGCGRSRRCSAAAR